MYVQESTGIISDFSPQGHNPVSDDELVSRAMAQLQNCAYPEVRGIACEAHDNVLVLIGRVPKFFYKQVAQALLIERLPGRPVIENQLIVDSEIGSFSKRLRQTRRRTRSEF
jgi:hypothetical protein